MSPQEYLAHLEDYQREPWGTRAVVMMLAQVCSILCNVHRAKDAPAYKPADFLPGQRDEPASKPATLADLTDLLKGA